MAKLSDVRRRFPPEDADAYDSAYAEATLAGELGAMLHAMRVAAGVDERELAARMGIDADEVARAEEGDPTTTVAYLDGVARALGSQVVVTSGETGVTLGRAAAPGGA